MEDGIKYFGVKTSVWDGKCLGAFIQMSKYDVLEHSRPPHSRG